MKNVPQNLIDHLNQEKNFTACDLYELEQFTGAKYYYSGADYPVNYDGKLYSVGPIFSREKVKLNDRVVVDSMTVTLYAGQQDKLASMAIMKAAHEGNLDRAKLVLRRCFFSSGAILGVIELFTGNIEIKRAGGLKLELTVKSKAQGLSQEFPIRKYFPQGTYSKGENGTVTSSTETDSCSLICPYVPLKEVLL